jgi:putative mycofactocin binding protein MftB
VPCRLAPGVQVRRESWGLLFYQQTRHKVCFVRSGDWLYPAHFDGTWTLESIAGDIARRTGAPAESIERSLPKLTRHLASNRMITDEVR